MRISTTRRVTGALAAAATMALLAPAMAQGHAMSFHQDNYSVNEFEPFASIRVDRTGSGTSPYVDYATSDGTANAGLDYTATSGTMVFGPNEQQKNFTVAILDDGLVEGDETVNLDLSNAGPAGDGHLGARTHAVLTIVDDDSLHAFKVANYSVDESAGTATIAVVRTGLTTGATSVNYATSDGTAAAGVDYDATSGTLQFAAGETEKSFTVPIIDDTDDEPDETVNLSLSGPAPGPGARRGTPSTAVLTILDNDDDVIIPTVVAPKPPAGPAAMPSPVAPKVGMLAPTGDGRGFVVSTSVGAAARVGAVVELRVGRHRYHARASARMAGAGKARLRVRLSRRARAAMRGALRRHRAVTVVVRVTAVDAKGVSHKTTRTFTVRA